MEEEVGPEAVAASTLELVDQMEIEISDHERGEGSGGEEKSKRGQKLRHAARVALSFDDVINWWVIAIIEVLCQS